jgi:hypothetical protein
MSGESVRQRARDWCKARGLRFHESIPMFAESESSLARKQEREANCKAMCEECASDKWNPPVREPDGRWTHWAKPGTKGVSYKCSAAAIHERGRDVEG